MTASTLANANRATVLVHGRNELHLKFNNDAELRRAYEELDALASAQEAAPCTFCNGRGFYGIPGQRCSLCDGTGRAPHAPAPQGAEAACPRCAGTGLAAYEFKDIAAPLQAVGGQGLTERNAVRDYIADFIEDNWSMRKYDLDAICEGIKKVDVAPAPVQAAPTEPEAMAILRDLTQHASEAGDHTPKSFNAGIVRLANRAHKVLATPAPAAQIPANVSDNAACDSSVSHKTAPVAADTLTDEQIKEGMAGRPLSPYCFEQGARFAERHYLAATPPRAIPAQEPGMQRAWEIVNALIVPGQLQGNGCDDTAQRNGLILAANAILAASGEQAKEAPRILALVAELAGMARTADSFPQADAIEAELERLISPPPPKG